MDEIQAGILAEINALKQLLSATDYQAIKHSEGEISDEEYASIRDKRRAWRNRINELEALSATLVTEEPETDGPVTEEPVTEEPEAEEPETEEPVTVMELESDN